MDFIYPSGQCEDDKIARPSWVKYYIHVCCLQCWAHYRDNDTPDNPTCVTTRGWRRPQPSPLLYQDNRAQVKMGQIH